MAKAINIFSYSSLLLLVVWLPIPFGSKPMWSIQAFQLVVFGTLLLWSLGKLLEPTVSRYKWNRIASIMFLLLVWLLYQLFQVAPLPSFALELLSTGSHDMYKAASRGQETATYAVSLDRGNTIQEAMKYSAYVALFLLVYALLDTRKRLLMLAFTLFLVGFMESAFGIYSLFADTMLTSREAQEGHRWASGTFLNRNHFAGHLLLVIGVGLGLLLCSHNSLRPWVSARNFAFNLTELLLRPSGWIFLCLIVLFSALFLSESRGGVLSLVAALLCICLLALIGEGNTGRASRLAVTAGAAILLAGIWFSSGKLISRFNEIGEDERIEQWKIAAEIVADYPVFGIGGGNYQWVFPEYRKGTLRIRTYDHAHSDYIETLVEQGVVGTVILGLAIGAIYIRLISVYRRRKSPFAKNMVTGVLVAMTALLFHGAMDFNFRVPANAAYFYIIAALGLAAATTDSTREKLRETEG